MRYILYVQIFFVGLRDNENKYMKGNVPQKNRSSAVKTDCSNRISDHNCGSSFVILIIVKCGSCSSVGIATD
jgi:hypothetical protein